MSQPPEGPPHIRGQLLLSRLDYLAKSQGSEATERVLAALPDADRERLRDLVRDEWYPLGSLFRLDRAIAEVLFPGDPEVFDRLGAASASHRTEWLGAHARLVSVHGFLQRVADEHRQFHSFGRAAYRRVGFNAGEIAFSEYPEVDEIYCLSARGFFRSAVELLTGEPAAVEEPRCQCRGDAECAFRVSWTRSLG